MAAKSRTHAGRTAEKAAKSGVAPSGGRPLAVPGPVGFLVALVALGALAWMCRNALFGAPVADDFYFLTRARLAGPVDPFDGGGFDYYWRPLTRQLYYAAFGGAMLHAPWVMGLVHSLALAALSALLWRIGRRFLAPLPALSFALLPLVAEASRLLLVWPTSAQPLFGAVATAAAFAALLAGRGGLAGLAYLAALLAYEQAAWAAPALLAIASREPERGPRVQRLGAILGACLVWTAGMVLARMHGVQWPVSGAAGAAGAATAGGTATPGAIAAYVLAVLGNVDTLAGSPRVVLGLAQAALLVVAVAWAAARPAPARTPRGAAPGLSTAVLAACATWGLVGLAPAVLAPDLWAPRHALMPSLVLGFVAVALCARASQWLAPALVGVRLIALLLAPVASASELERVQGDSRTSFVELVRLQRILASTQRCLAGIADEKPGGAAYWALPLRSVVAFAEGRAPKVWAADSSFGWGWMERPVRSPRQRGWSVIAYEVGSPDPACRVPAEALDGYFAAVAASDRQDLAGADSALAHASRAIVGRPLTVLDEIQRLRAGLAAMRGDLALAESLNLVSQKRYGPKADHVAIDGWIAMQRGDDARAYELAQICLKYEPQHPTGKVLLLALERRAAERRARSGQGDRPVAGAGR